MPSEFFAKTVWSPQLAFVELALREVAPGATRNTRSTVWPATIAIALRSGLPPLLLDNQEADEQVGVGIRN